MTLLDLIVNIHKLSENPIIFHTFSNGGLFIYRYLSEIVHQDDKYTVLRENIKTLVADSGPGLSTNYFEIVSNINSILKKYVNFIPIRYLLAAAGISVFVVKNRILFNDNNYFKIFLDAMVEDKFNNPMLVFYSKSDQLISSTSILDFVEKRRSAVLNSNIKTVEFLGSEHCSHYLKYPKVYYDHLKNHISEQNLPIYGDNLQLPVAKSQL